MVKDIMHAFMPPQDAKRREKRIKQLYIELCNGRSLRECAGEIQNRWLEESKLYISRNRIFQIILAYEQQPKRSLKC